MKLSVKDRLLLGQILPRESNLISQVICRDINKKINLSQSELESIGYRQTPNPDGTFLVFWDEKKTLEDLEVEFSEGEIRTLKDAVERLNAEQKINQDNLDLCLAIKDLGKKEDRDGRNTAGLG